MVKLTKYILLACIVLTQQACVKDLRTTSMMVAGIMSVPYWIYNLKIRWEPPLLRLWMAATGDINLAINVVPYPICRTSD